METRAFVRQSVQETDNKKSCKRRKMKIFPFARSKSRFVIDHPFTRGRPHLSVIHSLAWKRALPPACCSVHPFDMSAFGVKRDFTLKVSLHSVTRREFYLKIQIRMLKLFFESSQPFLAGVFKARISSTASFRRVLSYLTKVSSFILVPECKAIHWDRSSDAQIHTLRKRRTKIDLFPRLIFCKFIHSVLAVERVIICNFARERERRN